MADKSPSRSPQHKKHRLSKTTCDATVLLALTDKMTLMDDTFGSGMSDCDSSVDEIDDSFDANDNTIIHDCDDDDLDDSYDGSDDSYVDKNDRKALDLIMRNLKRTILENSLGKGTKTKEEQQLMDAISISIMSQDIVDLRLQSAVQRVTGMTPRQQDRGLEIHRIQSRRQGERIIHMPRNGHSFGPKSKVNLDFVYDCFHVDCPLVEPGSVSISRI